LKRLAPVDARAPGGSIAQPLLLHIPNYLNTFAADVLLRWAVSQVAWRREQIRMFGRDIMSPRLVAWFGNIDVHYRYSGLDHAALGWPDALTELRGSLARDFGFTSNFVLLNRYRSGRDSMGWHADDESALEGPVVSVSLGSSRYLQLRSTRQAPSSRLLLEHGALLLHDRSYYHAVPKTRRPKGERVNLTFRQVRSR